MNTILLAGFFAFCALCYMGLRLYWLGLPAVCQ